MEANNNLEKEANMIYEKIYHSSNENKFLNKKYILANQQENKTDTLYWTRYSNSSDPLPPLRSN